MSEAQACQQHNARGGALKTACMASTCDVVLHPSAQEVRHYSLSDLPCTAVSTAGANLWRPQSVGNILAANRAASWQNVIYLVPPCLLHARSSVNTAECVDCSLLQARAMLCTTHCIIKQDLMGRSRQHHSGTAAALYLCLGVGWLPIQQFDVV